MEIVVNQKSGLGNQLFQYAAGLFFAKQCQASLTVISEPEYKAFSHGYPRPFLLSKFQISAAVRQQTPLDRVLCSKKPRTLLLTESLRAIFRCDVYREPVGQWWHFEPNIRGTEGLRRLYLEGYWQAYQYATAVEPKLRRDLQFRSEAASTTLALFEQIRGRSSPVSLHIRRGDYTLAAEGNPALGLSYYRNALKALHDRIGEADIFVFSDDIAWARAHLTGTERLVFVDHNREATAYDDLRLMAACHHHIIANSSFSWWGAWLDPRPGKLVFFPDRHMDPKVPARDLHPPAWIKVSADTKAMDAGD